MTYSTNTTAFDKLEQRRVNYRFDLEEDIPWADLAMQGEHFGPRFCEKVGVDYARLSDNPEAMKLFQWAIGLEVAEAFYILESYLLDFVDDEEEQLGPNRSALLLYQEEVKHMALFRRYADYLRAARPDWVSKFDVEFTGYKPHPYTQDNYPNETVQHYFFWLKTLLFEEYTVYLYAELFEEKEMMQPVWLAAHRAHAREERQHVLTDAAHLDALVMRDTERRACSYAFWTHFESTFNEFLGISTAKSLIRKYFPDVADAVPDVAVDTLPIFQDILSNRNFKHTLRHAPLPANLVKVQELVA